MAQGGKVWGWEGGVKKATYILFTKGLNHLLRQTQVLDVGKGMAIDIAHPKQPAKEEPHLPMPAVPAGKRHSPLHYPSEVRVDVRRPDLSHVIWKSFLFGHPEKDAHGLFVGPNRVG